MTAIEAVGWLGNACFFGRFLVQWVFVERRRTRAAPRLFWLLSIAGSLLLGVFAAERGTWILLVGFTINGLIYARNLHLLGRGEDDLAPPMSRRAALGVASASLLALATAGVLRVLPASGETWGWTLVAVVGQAIWSSRFVVQWLGSERARESHFPPAFWTVSLAGNLLLLAYALHLWEPVFIAGLAFGPLVQLRNLWLTDPARMRTSRPARLAHSNSASAAPTASAPSSTTSP